MGQDECIFCRIVERKMSTPLVHEDKECVAFRDINPQAPVHILILPRRHIQSLHEMRNGGDEHLLGHLLLVASRIAEKEALSKNGYRTVLNTGANAGQTVFHLHVHVLGGRSFQWPPG